MPKAKAPSRADRWNEAVAAARAELEKAEAAKDEMEKALADAVSALEDVKAVQEEYQEWYDGMPDSLKQGATGEKLEAITSIDLEPDAEDYDAVASAIDEAEGADHPLGFGRD